MDTPFVPMARGEAIACVSSTSVVHEVVDALRAVPGLRVTDETDDILRVVRVDDRREVYSALRKGFLDIWIVRASREYFEREGGES